MSLSTALAGGRSQSWSAARLERIGWQIAKYAVLITFLVIFLYPFLWIWISALKTTAEISRDPFALPTAFRVQNLVRAWTVGRFGDYVLNTVIYCVAITGS